MVASLQSRSMIYLRLERYKINKYSHINEIFINFQIRNSSGEWNVTDPSEVSQVVLLEFFHGHIVKVSEPNCADKPAQCAHLQELFNKRSNQNLEIMKMVADILYQMSNHYRLHSMTLQLNQTFSQNKR